MIPNRWGHESASNQYEEADKGRSRAVQADYARPLRS